MYSLISNPRERVDDTGITAKKNHINNWKEKNENVCSLFPFCVLDLPIYFYARDFFFSRSIQSSDILATIYLVILYAVDIHFCIRRCNLIQDELHASSRKSSYCTNANLRNTNYCFWLSTKWWYSTNKTYSLSSFGYWISM